MKKFIAYALFAIVAGYLGAKFYIQYRTTKAVDEVIAALPPGIDVRYGSVSSTIDGTLSVDDLVIKTPEFQDEFVVGAVGIKLPSFFDILELQTLPERVVRGANDIPDSVGVFVDEWLIDTNADYARDMWADIEAARAASGKPPLDPSVDPVAFCIDAFGSSGLAALGASDLELSFDYKVEQLTESFLVSMGFDLKETYALDIELEFDGRLKSVLGMGSPQLTLIGFKLETRDERLMGLMLARCERFGVDAETAKMAYFNSTIESLVDMGFVPDERISVPLKAGIDAGHKVITITGQPPTPVDVSRISYYKPEDLPALLGVDLTTR
ncbi:MAG: hypothetical protein AAAFM81_07085 [Pseudomonadota bacterium]